MITINGMQYTPDQYKNFLRSIYEPKMKNKKTSKKFKKGFIDYSNDKITFEMALERAVYNREMIDLNDKKVAR